MEFSPRDVAEEVGLGILDPEPQIRAVLRRMGITCPFQTKQYVFEVKEELLGMWARKWKEAMGGFWLEQV